MGDGDRGAPCERGLDAQTIWTDDGIAVRLPEADETPAEETLLLDPDEIEES